MDLKVLACVSLQGEASQAWHVPGPLHCCGASPAEPEAQWQKAGAVLFRQGQVRFNALFMGHFFLGHMLLHHQNLATQSVLGVSLTTMKYSFEILYLFLGKITKDIYWSPDYTSEFMQ